MILYRPVGLEELKLIYNTGVREFPPRLPEQPIFYPVLNFEYAAQIAREWNTQSGSFAGYVTEFNVDDVYIAGFDSHIVGSRQHEEFWIPAQQLEEFNQHITGHITVTSAYFGPKFSGYVPIKFGMRNRNAVAQFLLLGSDFYYSLFDFVHEIKANSLAVFLHYPFWQQHDFSEEVIAVSNADYQSVSAEIRDTILEAIKESWSTSFPTVRLPELKK